MSVSCDLHHGLHTLHSKKRQPTSCMPLLEVSVRDISGDDTVISKDGLDEGWFVSQFQRLKMVPHRIHVWYIYLHLVDFYGKCRYLNIPYMDPMGLKFRHLEIEKEVCFHHPKNTAPIWTTTFLCRTCLPLLFPERSSASLGTFFSPQSSLSHAWSVCSTQTSVGHLKAVVECVLSRHYLQEMPIFPSSATWI